MRSSTVFNKKLNNKDLFSSELKYLFLCEVLNHIDAKNYSREITNVNYRVNKKDCLIVAKIHYTEFKVEVMLDLEDLREYLLDKGIVDFTESVLLEYTPEYVDSILEYEKSVQGELSLHIDNIGDRDYTEDIPNSSIFVDLDGIGINSVEGVLDFDNR